MHAFVIARDRVTYARQCVAALLDQGLRVTVVDHASTWPDMVDWLDHIEHHEDPALSVWRDTNRHPRDLWRSNGPIMNTVGASERFVVTDCDVIPDEACPTDWVGWMVVTLDRYPAMRKVGLSLRTDDLPEHFEHRDAVRRWEARYQPSTTGGALAPLASDSGKERGVVADVDTTLAMYRWFEPFRLGPAVRLSAPYTARHLAWYEDTANPTPEQLHYREHAAHGHWRAPDGYHDTHALRG